MKIHSILLLITAQCLLACSLHAQQPADKNDSNGVEMKKGIKFIILAFSLSTRDADNDQTLLVNYIDQSRYSWNTSIYAGYVFKRNLGAGLGISYGETKEHNHVKASDGTITYNQIYSNNYSFNPFIKNFIPLDLKHRFYVINQTELQLSFGQGVNESTVNDVLTRSYSTKNGYGIGLKPGLMVFVVKNFAFETTVDVFGVKTSVEKTKTTGLPDGKVVKTDIDLRISLLQLAFGFSIYF